MGRDTDLYECPSPDCTWTTEGIPGLAEHINENHSGGFKRNDWLSFSNPNAVQYGSNPERTQKIDADEREENESEE